MLVPASALCQRRPCGRLGGGGGMSVACLLAASRQITGEGTEGDGESDTVKARPSQDR